MKLQVTLKNRRSFIPFLPLLAGFVFGACSSTPNIPEVESADAQLFLNKCTQCHSWPHPGRHTAREWDHYLEIMEGHMKEKGLPFSSEDKKIIQSYLHRNGR